MSAHFPISRELANGAGEALEALSHDVEGLGVALCADPTIAEQFLDQLQGIDRIAQTLEQLSNVLRAPVPEEAIDEVRVGDLQAQLRQAHEA